MASLRFVFDETSLRGRLRVDLMAPGGIIRRDVQRRAGNVRDRARALARQRSEQSSGALPASIRYVTVELSGSDMIGAQVGSDLSHAKWTEEGTGIYGPHRTPIVPRQAQFLRFRSRKFASTRSTRGSGAFGVAQGRIFLVRSVKGQPGKHYLRDALGAAIP